MAKLALALVCLVGVSARKPLVDNDSLATLLLATPTAHAKPIKTRTTRMAMQDKIDNQRQELMPQEAVKAMSLAAALAPGAAMAGGFDFLITPATFAFVGWSVIMCLLVPYSLASSPTSWEELKGRVFQGFFIWIALLFGNGILAFDSIVR